MTIRIDPATDCLGLIDVQPTFMPGGGLAVAEGDLVVPVINRILPLFALAFATQDWHPPDHMSFAENHPGAAPFSAIDMAYGPQVLWPAHCVIGTAGAAFHPDLAVDRADLVIRKGFRAQIDSYSAFFENDHQTSTGLAGYLRDRDLTELSFVGLAHDFCVSWSAIDAAGLGFRATVLEAATRAIDLNGSRDAARDAMRMAGVILA